VSSSHSVTTVTCLGCGCGCDDLSVRVTDGRIVEITPPCPVGRRWFGDGSVPGAVLRGGKPAPADEAIAEASDVLAAAAGRAIVYIGPDLTTEAHRAALAIADLLHARVDSATSATAAAGLLAAQRRGRAGATLGEIRNRADVLLFWGIDPQARYPRFLERFIDAAGTHVPGGRAGRRLISVTIGAARGPSGADLAITLEPKDEIDAISVMRATASGNTIDKLPANLEPATEAARLLLGAKYAVIIVEAEPGAERPDPARSEGLIALTQALNGSTRAALTSLRAGGNRTGAEAALTWQTGFPMGVDFSRGYPRYAPEGKVLHGGVDAGAALLVGSIDGLPEDATAALGRIPTVLIGPRASRAPFAPRVAIDTGIAGIHEDGTGYRLDEIPLPLRPPLPGARSASGTLHVLLTALHARGSQR
jgi:formylmethanofuran dehydrogenase subunit B